jgi:DNA polymerase-3 subunit delta
VNVRPEDLGAHLKRGLQPLYVVHGDEPLLALEAADAIRAAARSAGVDEREVFVVDASFRWDAFLAANANLGLFGSRKLVDVRIPTGRPGAEGGRALEQYASSPNPDNVALVTLPRLDKAAQATAWFASLAEAGIVVAVQPLEREALPRWIAARLARQGQAAAPETLAFLADHCEGNLLAARQEIEKLALVLPEGLLEADAVERVVADVARYDVFAASEAWLAGDAARVLRILSVLEAEGDGPQLALWALGEDLHAIAAVHAMVRSGTPMQAALRNARVWGRRATALERATRRIDTASVDALLPPLFRVDALSKGLGGGRAWDELVALALAVAGSPARPLAQVAAGVPEEVRR